MTRTRRRRPNWPYRLAWVAILLCVALYVFVQTMIGALGHGGHGHRVDWGLAIVAACLDATVAIWFVAIGASIGSFLNVVAYRLPIGRNIGGHSGCPYCQSSIEGRDNVPVLAWIKLRGRCRTCRLPISVQYPLVELAVAIIFLVIYLTEFSTAGTNLPDAQRQAMFGGLMRIMVTSQLVLRIVLYLFTMSGLVAAALIAVRGQRVPLKLFAWTLVPWTIATLWRPDLIVIPWKMPDSFGPAEIRLHVVATILCGAAAAVTVARLLAPFVYGKFDRKLIAADKSTSGARQFMGASAVVGCLLGWQAVVPFMWTLVLSAIVSVVLLRRFRNRTFQNDLTVWMWLGLLLFRANWNWLNWNWLLRTEIFRFEASEVMVNICAAILLIPAAALFARLSRRDDIENFGKAEESTSAEPTMPNNSKAYSEEDASETASEHAIEPADIQAPPQPPVG